MSAGRLLIVVIASALALFAGVNLFAATVLGGARLDLTERGLYRLSPGAVEVVGRLDEPVTLTFYYSRASAARYPALRAYGARE
jgi:ABC-2 type transport system permease protein